MANYYCEYCGDKRSSIQTLTMQACTRHPLGPHKGKHKLYEGSEKQRYECKYCGESKDSIAKLTLGKCVRHPDGIHKGRHAPTL